MITSRSFLIVAAAALLSSACTKEPNSQPTPEKTSAPVTATEKSGAQPSGAQKATTPAAVAQQPRQAAAQPSAQGAEIGKPAPPFSLEDLDGKTVALEQFRGKRVVLEWFNPQCPFVNKAHGKGSLAGAAAKHAASGVVWLAINSGAPGKQGHGVEANRAGAERFGMSHPVLLDEDGSVGRAYGAQHTPHMFVIDETGVLIYKGAIDNSPDAEGASPKGGTLVNYVEQALTSAAAGKPVDTTETEAYGCSVKYAN